MAEDKKNQPEPFESELEKELYKGSASKRIGRVKKIWGVRRKDEAESEVWSNAPRPTRPSRGLPLAKIFFWSLILFIISSLIFGFVVYYRRIYISGINFNLVGPTKTDALAVNNYDVQVSNNSNSNLDNVSLKIELDQYGYFVGAGQSKTKNYSLGQLMSGQNTSIKTPIFFFGPKNKISDIKLILTYSPAGRNQNFEMTNSLAVTIDKEALSFQSFLPNQILSGEPFSASFQLSNVSSQPYDLSLKLDLPPGAILNSASPPYSKYLEWQLPNFGPNNSSNINLTLQFNNIPIAPVILITPVITYEGVVLTSSQIPVSLQVLSSPIAFTITSYPSDQAVSLPTNMTYTVSWVNKSSIDLKNVQIKVNLNGPFDLGSIKTDGYFSAIDNALIWDARNKSSLADIPPNGQGSVSFSIQTLNNYPVSSVDQKDFSLEVKAEMSTASIPPEIQTIAKQISWSASDNKNIIGDIKISPTIDYQDTVISNSGPYPFQSGQPTTLTVHLKITTIGEKFENVLIKTKIPAGVKLTGVWAGDFNPNNLSYDSQTGDFLYHINELPANLGYGMNPYDLAFQIQVQPPLYGDINNFIALTQIQLSAQGQFSKKVFDLTIPPLSLSNIISGNRNY